MNVGLIPRFEKYQLKYDLITSNMRILIAVSGGIDSIVMLDLLYQIKKKYNLFFAVAHVNYQLRGNESEEDATFVKQLSNDYQMEYHFMKVGEAEFKDNSNQSIQEIARDLRYDFFGKLSENYHYDRIATGHNQNDHSETFLINLFRGSGLKGLAGIPRKRDNIIRPMLFLSRKEIHNYAKRNHLNYRQDSTNMTMKYFRNRIRNSLLPEITEKFQPNINSILSRTADRISEAVEWITSETKECYIKSLKKERKWYIILDIMKYRGYLVYLRKELILFSLKKLLNIVPSFNYFELEELIGGIDRNSTGWTYKTRNSVNVTIDRDDLVFWMDNLFGSILYDFQVPGECHVSELEKKLNGNWSNSDEISLYRKNKNIEVVDFEKLKLPLSVGTWSAGEKLRPIGMQSFKKLSDIFIDNKVPLYLKPRIPILKDMEKIVWVCGYCLDDRVKATPRTSKFLKFELLNINDKKLSR